MTDEGESRKSCGVNESDLREAFELFDEDKDGEITLDELQKVRSIIECHFHSYSVWK